MPQAGQLPRPVKYEPVTRQNRFAQVRYRISRTPRARTHIALISQAWTIHTADSAGWLPQLIDGVNMGPGTGGQWPGHVKVVSEPADAVLREMPMTGKLGHGRWPVKCCVPSAGSRKSPSRKGISDRTDRVPWRQRSAQRC